MGAPSHHNERQLCTRCSKHRVCLVVEGKIVCRGCIDVDRQRERENSDRAVARRERERIEQREAEDRRRTERAFERLRANRLELCG